MPSSSKKQHNFMEAIAHSSSFAKKVGVPQKVGKDFAEADKGKKFATGGVSRAKEQSINKPKTNHGAEALFSKGGNMATKKMDPRIAAMMAARMAGQGAPAAPSGMPPGMKKGGMSMAAFEKSGKDVEKKGMKEGSKADMALDKKQMMGMKKGGMKKMAGGGSVDSGNSTSITKVRSAAPSKDGVASKGKTQGKQIVMAGNKGMKRGGKTC